MNRLVAWFLLIVLITPACATTPRLRAGEITIGPAAKTVVDHAACEEQAKTGVDTETLRLSLGSGFAGMLLVALYSAADGAYIAALAGGSAGDGAWIGAVVGAGVGAIIGIVVGLKKAQEAKATYAARLDECLRESRETMTATPL